MSLLEVSNLRKTFGDLVAVDDVSFHVNVGEVFGFLGPNGAGKSTTMMMLAGLLKPDSGTVRLDGRELNHNNRDIRTVLGVVPQELAVYPDLTARENLNFFGRLYGVKGKQLHRRVESALERIGLTGRADGFVGTYSGGMKRRLNFAVALLHEPRLLILDEPTVGVDPQSRSHLLDCIRELSGDGIAAIYASHYMEEVQAICQRLAIIDHGKMIACDSLDELLGRLSSDLCLRVERPSAELLEQLQGLAEIESSPEDRATTTIIISPDRHENEQSLNRSLTKVVELLDQCGIRLHGIETHEPNLERLFLELTGKRLRD